MKNRHINLSTALQKDFAQMIYSEKTTVADVKHFIHTQTRSPVKQQTLYALVPIWWSCGYLNYRSKPLKNNEKIGKIADQHQTDQFIMWLTSKKRRNHR
ncbi:hypothetical protein IPH67_00045 [bacterium]|nr:MAG: hypothetical protein IPH67_00045 [bacterium]